MPRPDGEQRPNHDPRGNGWFVKHALDVQRTNGDPEEDARDVTSSSGGSTAWPDHESSSGGSTAWPDHAIALVAARQRALITHEQLIALGVGRTAIVNALRRGRLHRSHRNVYALVDPKALPSWAAEQAALLACGSRALLSHESAAVLWGLSPPTSLDGAVFLTVVNSEAGRRRSGIRVHRVGDLDRRDTRRRKSLPVTAPARTLLDMTPRFTDRELELALDETLVRRLTSATAVAEMLNRYPRRPGAPRLRDLLELDRSTTFTRSDGEECLLALIRRGGLDPPELNVGLGGFEVDFLWRHERMIVEVDGFAFHGTRTAFERDRRRDAVLQNGGFRVIRVTWRQLTREPEAVLVSIATALSVARGATQR